MTGFADSPIGLATFLLDHDSAQSGAHRAFVRRADRGLTPDDASDNVTLFG